MLPAAPLQHEVPRHRLRPATHHPRPLTGVARPLGRKSRAAALRVAYAAGMYSGDALRHAPQPARTSRARRPDSRRHRPCGRCRWPPAGRHHSQEHAGAPHRCRAERGCTQWAWPDGRGGPCSSAAGVAAPTGGTSGCVLSLGEVEAPEPAAAATPRRDPTQPPCRPTPPLAPPPTRHGGALTGRGASTGPIAATSGRCRVRFLRRRGRNRSSESAASGASCAGGGVAFGGGASTGAAVAAVADASTGCGTSERGEPLALHPWKGAFLPAADAGSARALLRARRRLAQAVPVGSRSQTQGGASASS